MRVLVGYVSDRGAALALSGWIKVEKDLANDPRVLRMASRLRNADVTLGSRSRLAIVGALVTLWWYADTHIGNDDVLPIGADQVNELVGLDNFCELMPTDWLQVIDANNVKLVDYTAHNGSIAKNRALNQKRQQRHRNITDESRSRNGDVTQDALPDKTKTRQDKDKREEIKPTAATRPAPAPEFTRFKLTFPSRAGSQPWNRALKAINARLAEGHSWGEIIAGAERYADFIVATGKLNTEHTMQAATFCGPDKHFLQTWAPPPTKADVRLGNNLSAAEEFMRRTEGAA